MKPAGAQSFQRFLAKNVIIAPIPQHHGATAVLPLWNHSFEAGVLDRMVLYFNRQMLFAFRPGKPLGHRPGFQHAIHLEAKIVVQSTRVVFLNDETRGAFNELRQWLAALRFGGHREVPLLLVFG